MKALLLAGGRREGSQLDHHKILHQLKGKRVIDYVVELALNFVEPEDLYVVVGHQKEQVKKHLDPSFHYITQHEQLGTGHAVVQAEQEFANPPDRVLVLYGDTPLIKERSIRGLLNIHELKGPALTIFSALVENPNPYGRVVRNDTGEIKDIVEVKEEGLGSEALPKEINIGAYVGDWNPLLASLKKIEKDKKPKTVLLTDAVTTLATEAGGVQSYQTYDTDEIVGINNSEDLELAEFIMKKRSFQPLKEEEENLINFGTGGWRAVIGEGFTFDNVRRLAQSVSNKIIKEGKENEKVIVGYDNRFLSRRFARAIAEVIAGNNISVLVFPRSTPTPVVTHTTMSTGAYLGIIVTASHNPPKYNGIKIQLEGGYPITDDIANSLAREANSLTPRNIVKSSFELGKQANVIEERDYTNSYIDDVESMIDMDAIREAGLRVILDPMYGVGQVTLETVLTEARCQITTIHERKDPLFGGRSPSPDLSSLGALINQVKEGEYDLGLAMDGDADRIAVIDDQGQYVDINSVMLVLYFYLHEYLGRDGPVVRNVATTHLLDRLAETLGKKCLEVPVGFKHISKEMRGANALLGGESSGGMTIKGHIPGKDGVLAASLIVSMIGTTNKSMRDLVEEVLDITGKLYQEEENIPYQGEMRANLTEKFQSCDLEQIVGFPVIETLHLDGAKFILEDDNWVLVRFSGTEPVLRLRSEADSAEKARNLIRGIRDIFSIEENDL